MTQERKEMAQAIISDPKSYKVCKICGSISDKEAPICPDCYAYRFNSNPKHVTEKAIDLAAFPQQAVSHLDEHKD